MPGRRRRRGRVVAIGRVGNADAQESYFYNHGDHAGKEKEVFIGFLIINWETVGAANSPNGVANKRKKKEKQLFTEEEKGFLYLEIVTRINYC